MVRKYHIDQKVKVKNSVTENARRFSYPGSVFTCDNDCSQDVWVRIQKATAVLKSTQNI